MIVGRERTGIPVKDPLQATKLYTTWITAVLSTGCLRIVREVPVRGTVAIRL